MTQTITKPAPIKVDPKQLQELQGYQKRLAELKIQFKKNGIDTKEQAVLDALQKQIDQRLKAWSVNAPPTAPATPAPTALPQQAAVSADSAPIMPLTPPNEMDDEDVAAHIVDKQVAILVGWEKALQVFDKTMTSDSDKEAKPDFQGAVTKYFRDKLVGELVKRAPMAAEVKGLTDAIDGEIQRAAKSQASATLRDFVNQHATAIGNLGQTILKQRQGFISAVKKRRQAAGVDEAPRGPAKPGNKKPVGKVEVSPKALEDWTNMRMALMELLDAIDKSLAEATREKLLRVLSEAWIRQGTTGKIAGQPIPAVVIIKLNPNLSMKEAHIQASGGQKLAEQLLRDSPEGVDVFGLKAQRRILHYGDNNWPQATLELDANNRDLTAMADRNGKYEALKKYVMSKGLPPTKKITGD